MSALLSTLFGPPCAIELVLENDGKRKTTSLTRDRKKQDYAFIYSGYFKKHTRNGWKRCKNTLETGGKDVKIHSKRVGKILSFRWRGRFWNGHGCY
jgi:hypothetical protein